MTHPAETAEAVGATPWHGVVTPVQAAAVGAEVWLRLEVQDNGCGISAANKARLFRAFVQIEAGRLQASKGTGLGLYICSQIVRRLGGRIGVDSSVGAGSVFFAEWPVRIPAVDEHAEGPPLPSGRTPVAVAVSLVPLPAARVGILVVDDDVPSRMFLSRALRRHLPDAIMWEADSGTSAVDMVTADMPQFDLICLDNEMSGGDGVTAARTLRARGYRGVIVGVTGALQGKEMQRFLDAGADAIVGKPVRLSELMDIVTRHLLDRRERTLPPEAAVRPAEAAHSGMAVRTGEMCEAPSRVRSPTPQQGPSTAMALTVVSHNNPITVGSGGEVSV